WNEDVLELVSTDAHLLCSIVSSSRTEMQRCPQNLCPLPRSQTSMKCSFAGTGLQHCHAGLAYTLMNEDPSLTSDLMQRSLLRRGCRSGSAGAGVYGG